MTLLLITLSFFVGSVIVLLIQNFKLSKKLTEKDEQIKVLIGETERWQEYNVAIIQDIEWLVDGHNQEAKTQVKRKWMRYITQKKKIQAESKGLNTVEAKN